MCVKPRTGMVPAVLAHSAPPGDGHRAVAYRPSRRSLSAFAVVTLALGLVLSPRPGAAQTASCTASLGNVTIGPVNPLSGQSYDAVATLTVNCTGEFNDTVSVCAGLGAGSAGTNSSGVRLLASTDGQISYTISQDAGHAVPWGSSSVPSLGSQVLLSRTGPGLIERAVYFRIPSGQTTAAPGTYTSSFSSADATIRSGQTTLASCADTSALTLTNDFTFTVSAEVQKSCTVNVLQHVNFGTVVSLDQPVDATGGLAVHCTAATPYAVGLSEGGGSGATVAARRMSGPGGATINYSLFRNQGRSDIWGHTPNVDVQPGTGNGLTQELTVYGRIASGQGAKPAGSYSDTVIVSVTY